MLTDRRGCDGLQPMADAHRRLLDLLAGWTQQVDDLARADQDLPNGPSRAEYAREAEAIGDLYQAAGSLALGEASADEVAAFVVEKVIPLLQRGT